MKIREIKLMLLGREREFLAYAGLPQEVAFKRHHQACGCAPSKDALRITDTGYYYCNKGTQGDYFALLEHYLGIQFKDSINLAKDFLGIENINKSDIEDIKKKAREIARKNKIRSMVKDDNNKLDYDLVYLLESLEITIKNRPDDQLPDDEELKLVDDLQIELMKRYSKIYKKREFLKKNGIDDSR